MHDSCPNVRGDPFEDAVDIATHVLIREAQHTQTLLLKERLPHKVVIPRVLMDVTVYLNHQQSLAGVEIDDEAVDGVLSAKLSASKATIAEMLPQRVLSSRRLGAHLPSQRLHVGPEF
jgi:hypothetical protein